MSKEREQASKPCVTPVGCTNETREASARRRGSPRLAALFVLDPAARENLCQEGRDRAFRNRARERGPRHAPVGRDGFFQIQPRGPPRVAPRRRRGGPRVFKSARATQEKKCPLLCALFVVERKGARAPRKSIQQREKGSSLSPLAARATRDRCEEGIPSKSGEFMRDVRRPRRSRRVSPRTRARVACDSQGGADQPRFPKRLGGNSRHYGTFPVADSDDRSFQ